MYMHDILFKARLHPQKKISEMDDDSFNKNGQYIFFYMPECQRLQNEIG